jgi:hypothetical protein
MLAQRATPALMGRVGDDADRAQQGYTVGAFIERVHLTRDWIHCDIPVRWPDKIGEMINPTDEAVFSDGGFAESQYSGMPSDV